MQDILKRCEVQPKEDGDSFPETQSHTRNTKKLRKCQGPKPIRFLTCHHRLRIGIALQNKVSLPGCRRRCEGCEWRIVDGWIRVDVADVALSRGVAIDAATAAARSPRIRGGQLRVAIPRPEQTSKNQKDMISMIPMINAYLQNIYRYISCHIPNIQDDITIM